MYLFEDSGCCCYMQVYFAHCHTIVIDVSELATVQCCSDCIKLLASTSTS